MRIQFTLQNMNRMKNTLEQAGFEIKDNWKGEMLKKGYEIRDRAKEVLEQRSMERTNKQYWTGRLQSAIVGEPILREDNIFGFTIRVDDRIARSYNNEAYGEWVEFGHLVERSLDQRSEEGKFFEEYWWEGYHFMQQAYVEIAPTIEPQIANTTRAIIKKFEARAGRAAHQRTGKFIKESAGLRIVN